MITSVNSIKLTPLADERPSWSYIVQKSLQATLAAIRSVPHGKVSADDLEAIPALLGDCHQAFLNTAELSGFKNREEV